MPQTYRPGAEAEVDFHDLWVVLAGVMTKTALFTMRLSFSGRAAHRAFVPQGQEAFLAGHVHGFDRLGGVPADRIRYDNLNSAVTQVLFGRSRQENEHWIAFRSHYGFEAWYCQPGHEGSHEKGGVEPRHTDFSRRRADTPPAGPQLHEPLTLGRLRTTPRPILHPTRRCQHNLHNLEKVLRPHLETTVPSYVPPTSEPVGQAPRSRLDGDRYS